MDDGDLEVEVVLENKGDEPASPLTVVGDLLGETREAQLEAGVAANARGEARLRFPLGSPRPGLHALDLLIEWPVGPPASGGTAPPVASQRAYLLVTLGVPAEPAVRVSLAPLTLETDGTLLVGLESADGLPHEVEIRVLTPRGLNVFVPAPRVAVPAQGHASARTRLLRAGAPRESQQGIVVVARALDGPEERTAVATGLVTLSGEPGLLPGVRGLRPALWFLAAGLLAYAFLVEIRGRRAAA